MDLNYEKFINKLAGSKAPDGLLRDVMLRISSERLARRAKKHLFIFSFLSAASLTAWGFSFYQAQADFSGSGLGQFLRLLFSDFAIVVVYWKFFVFSVAERIPLVSLMALCASSLFLALCLKAVSKDLKNLFFLGRASHN